MWLVLAALYWLVVEGVPGGDVQAARIDPMAPQSRAVERAILEGRLEAALTLAADLEQQYPTDPLGPYWQTAIFRGLQRPEDEAAAWERFMARSSEDAAACPHVVHAYARAGALDRSAQAGALCQALENQPAGGAGGKRHD